MNYNQTNKTWNEVHENLIIYVNENYRREKCKKLLTENPEDK